MSDSVSCKDTVQVAVINDQAIVRIIGRGSFNISTSVKDFSLAEISAGVHELVFDLDDCIGMDSTFMGMVAGLAFRLRKLQPPGRVVMVNLTDKTFNLLKTLGLDQVVVTQMHHQPDAVLPRNHEAELEEVSSDEARSRKAETALEAHQNLVKVDADNLPKFKDVIAFLKEDVAKNKGSSA